MLPFFAIMPPTSAPYLRVLAAALVVGGCVLVLLFTRVASGPVLALLRQVMGDLTLGPSAYWLSTGVVLLGAPLAGWWADQAGRRVSVGVGVALVAAGLTLLGFLMRQMWMPLYVIVAFGVVLVGVSAAATVGVIARRVALATALAFCLPFVQVVPNVSPGMRPLLEAGERGFVMLGLAFLAAALLPLAALGLGAILERRLAVADAGTDAAAEGPTTIDPLAATVVLACCGWIAQVGPAAADLTRTFPTQETGRSMWPVLVVLLASASSYVWAIGADFWVRPSQARPRGGPMDVVIAAALAVFAAGTLLVAVAQGTTMFSMGLFLAAAGVGGVVPIVIAAHLRGVDVTRWAGSIGLSIGVYMFGQSLGVQLNVYIAAWAGALGAVVVSGFVAAGLAAWLWRSQRR